MDAPIAGIDHTLVGVADLEAARSAWTRLGFTLSPRGRHIGWGTANYCILFDEDYVELLGIVDPSQFTNRLDRFLATRGEGLLGLAWRSRDAEASAAAFAAMGIAAEGPKDLQRILELPAGEARPAFRLVFPDPAALPGLSNFLCHHLSRALVWNPDWTRHANGALGLAEVTVATRQAAAFAPAYRRVFGEAAVALAGESLTVSVGGGASLRFRPPESGDPVAEGPVGFTLRVAELAATEAFLQTAGLSPRRAGSSIEVSPAVASGVRLVFAAR